MTDDLTFGKISNGHISARGRPIHFMFGFAVGFSGSADRMALESNCGLTKFKRYVGENNARDWSQSKVFLVPHNFIFNVIWFLFSYFICNILFDYTV